MKIVINSSLTVNRVFFGKMFYLKMLKDSKGLNKQNLEMY